MNYIDVTLNGKKISVPDSYRLFDLTKYTKIDAGKQKFKIQKFVMAQQVANPTSMHEDAGLIPSLTQWFEDPDLL